MSNEIENCVICGRVLEGPDERKRVTCNTLHAKYLRNLEGYITIRINRRVRAVKRKFNLKS